MDKHSTLTLLLISLIALCAVNIMPAWAVIEDSWTTKTPMQVARGNLGVGVVDGKIYALGGYDGSGPYLNTNEEYDPSTDMWTFKASMPTPMAFFGVAVYQDKIYCIGGENGENEVYDPATDTWETKASLPNPRKGITANVVADRIYVIGGETNTTDVYDPATDSWTAKAPMPVVVKLNRGWTCASAVVDGMIHVIGVGVRSNVNVVFHEIYSAGSDSWSSSGAERPSGGLLSVACATLGVHTSKRFYVFGIDRFEWGLNYPEFKTLVYSPESNSWALGSQMPTGRIAPGVAVVDDRVYVIGGFVPNIGYNLYARAVNEVYTPIGYDASSSSYESPSPSLSPSQNLSPSPNSTPTPSASTSPSATGQPTQSPEPASTPTFPAEYIAVTAAAVVIIAVAAAFMLRRRDNKRIR